MSKEGWRAGFVVRGGDQELRAVDEMREAMGKGTVGVGGANATWRPCWLDNCSMVDPLFSRIAFFVGIFFKSRIFSKWLRTKDGHTYILTYFFNNDVKETTN
jgi:hypothetical protein